MSYWILLQTVQGKELQAESDLSSAGYDVYLPRKRTDMRTRRNRKLIIEALYPSYLFIRFTEGVDDLRPVKKIVLRIVHFGDDIAKASDALIDQLRSREDSQGVHATKHRYEAGDSVLIQSGPLKDYAATIDSIGKHDRVVIHLLNTGKLIEVPTSDLRPAA